MTLRHRIDRPRPLRAAVVDPRSGNQALMTRALCLLAAGLVLVAASLPLNAASSDQPKANQGDEQKASQPNTLQNPSDDRSMMGYGTTPITDDRVTDPTLGNRSMMGTPAGAGQQAEPGSAEQAFGDLDQNGDGFLTKAEAGNIPSERWQRIDSNGDDVIDRSEFSAFESGKSRED